MTTLAQPSTDPACCSPGAGTPLAAATATDWAHTFKALADPNRLRLLSLIKAGDAAGTCVCDLTEPLALAQPTVSHHLKILVDAGLLAREKRGTWAYYTLVPGALQHATAVLTEL